MLGRWFLLIWAHNSVGFAVLGLLLGFLGFWGLPLALNGLIDQAKRESDKAKRNQLLQDAQKIEYESGLRRTNSTALSTFCRSLANMPKYSLRFSGSTCRSVDSNSIGDDEAPSASLDRAPSCIDARRRRSAVWRRSSRARSTKPRTARR